MARVGSVSCSHGRTGSIQLTWGVEQFVGVAQVLQDVFQGRVLLDPVHELEALVQLGPYHLDSFMDGTMLIFTHRDVPGLIGFIGTIFGKHAVNITQMTVGRQLPGGEAIAVLNLDAQPPDEAPKDGVGNPRHGRENLRRPQHYVANA